MNERTNERTDGRTDGRTNEQTNERMPHISPSLMAVYINIFFGGRSNVSEMFELAVVLVIDAFAPRKFRLTRE